MLLVEYSPIDKMCYCSHNYEFKWCSKFSCQVIWECSI